jgi:hypothetical protein
VLIAVDRNRRSCPIRYARTWMVLGKETMSHKHEQLLRAIFHDPISANIHWREVESLLNHIGADVESLSGARVRVKLNGAEGILHRPHHGNTLDRSAVRHLREYLAHARMTPSQYEAARAAQH